MKALRIHGYEQPLQIEEAPMPTPGPGQVVVENHFTSLNGVDPGRAGGFLRAVFQLEFPWTPGGDVAGRVSAVGEGVTDFKAGDEVFGYTAAGGAYAEFTRLDAANLAHRPAGISREQAAAIALVGQTAMQVLALAKARAGKTILIMGAAGGVGSLAVQLAHAAGVHVIASARQSQTEALKKLGAERVHDYTREPLDAIAPVDAVINLVGGDTVAKSYARVKPGGVAVTSNRPPDMAEAARLRIEAAFVQTVVQTERLDAFAKLVIDGTIEPQIATIETLWSPDSIWKERESDNLGKVVFSIRP